MFGYSAIAFFRRSMNRLMAMISRTASSTPSTASAAIMATFHTGIGSAG